MRTTNVLITRDLSALRLGMIDHLRALLDATVGGMPAFANAVVLSSLCIVRYIRSYIERNIIKLKHL